MNSNCPKVAYNVHGRKPSKLRERLTSDIDVRSQMNVFPGEKVMYSATEITLGRLGKKKSVHRSTSI